MKVHEILNLPKIYMTNEEKKFVKQYHMPVELASLDPHETWIAQQLVRKGVYDTGRTGQTIKLRTQ